jgi:phosphoribosylamine--glycine ligase
MKIIVVGSGGREHALALRLACGAGDVPRDDREVVVVPGNAGIANHFKILHTGQPPESSCRCRCRGLDRGASESDVDAVTRVCVDEGADLVVVGPESFLEAGLIDALQAVGVVAFGPTRAAARLESSKAFMKGVARDACVPTADFVVVDAAADAEAFFAARADVGVVVKADGLAAGKGVVVAASVDEARVALAEMLGSAGAPPRFGDASRRCIVEDLLPGDEVSVFALCNGDDAVILGAARDHKRIGDGDTGPNTGGMGAVGPLGADEGIDDAFLDDVRARFVVPTLKAMAKVGAPFRGVLFVGLMVGPEGPRLLEYNVRFGDPETEALLFALDVDLVPTLLACAQGQPLSSSPAGAGARKGAVVVVAAEGYPQAPEKGAPIVGLLQAMMMPDVEVFCAGVAVGAFGLVADGGRVLAIAGRGDTFDDALDNAYAAVDVIHMEGRQVRRDIGASVRRRGPSSPRSLLLH